jgi:hypothetical protein
MESAWSNGKPAYRCRQCHTSAQVSGPARVKNAYVREDRILAHLPITSRDRHPHTHGQVTARTDAGPTAITGRGRAGPADPGRQRSLRQRAAAHIA